MKYGGAADGITDAENTKTTLKKERLVWPFVVNKERQKRSADAAQVSRVTEVDIFQAQSLCLMHQTTPPHTSSEEGGAPAAGKMIIILVATKAGPPRQAEVLIV